MSAPQSYANHSRFQPLFHFVLAPILLMAMILAVVNCVYTLRAGFNFQNFFMALWMLLMSAGAFLAAALIRLNALAVQDRVIAVEVERRYERLGGKANTPLSENLEPGQLVGLRFASDAELVELADRAVAEKLGNRAIKQAIKTWRADNRRV